MNGATLFVVGLALGAVAGTQIKPGMFGGDNHGGLTVGLAPYQDLSDERMNIWPTDLPTPTVDIDLRPDPASGHNLFLTTTNFEMTPQDVNTAVAPGTGHGHLFVNGENVGRLYGNMHHLINLPTGDVTLHVYMGGNDHKVWMIDGTPLFVEKSFVIE